MLVFLAKLQDGQDMHKFCSKAERNASLGRVGVNGKTINIVAYLSHARKVEPQNQPFLSNTRTNN
jgi:hypothetical protein